MFEWLKAITDHFTGETLVLSNKLIKVESQP